MDIVQRFFQVAVVVEGVDDDLDQRTVARRDAGQAHLFHQVLAQRDRAGFQLRTAVLFVAAVARAARLAPLHVAVAAGAFVAAFMMALGLAVAAALFALAGRGWRVGRGGGLRAIVDRTVRQQAHRAVERIVEAFEQRVLAQDLFDLLVEFERGQLQQADRLLELRCQRKVL
jgi:hypothetical protein